MILLITLVLLSFGFVLLFGAPYLPTLRRQRETALDLLDLKPGQILLELGSGDGRMMRAAAKRDLFVVGYELNPLLVLISYLITWHYRKQVKIVWGNFWSARWPKADGVYTFLLDKYMEKLDAKIKASAKNRPFKLASFTFLVPGKRPAKNRDGVFFYRY
jgi:16S rRNA A1518/A1519 N6-dimethyltransferase RsmA/KsgA/DIM1 with predicted DNA glycosylase/AP lyase activity